MENFESEPTPKKSIIVDNSSKRLEDNTSKRVTIVDNLDHGSKRTYLDTSSIRSEDESTSNRSMYLDDESTSKRMLYIDDLPTSKRRKILTLDPKPLSFRSYLASAYAFYEEEKLIELESKLPKTCLGALTEGTKKKQSAQGDKLMFKLKKLLELS